MGLKFYRSSFLNYKYSILDIWKQAEEDYSCVNSSFGKKKSYIYKGIKIEKTADHIKIYNTKSYQIQYSEISGEDYYYFHTKGFREGVKKILKQVYINKINILNDLIKKELNTRNNKKHFKSLKFKRDNLLIKYRKISK
jgi:hypothetical protein